MYRVFVDNPKWRQGPVYRDLVIYASASPFPASAAGERRLCGCSDNDVVVYGPDKGQTE